MKRQITLRNYRTYLLNLSFRLPEKEGRELSVWAKTATTKELRARFANEKF